MSPNNRELVQQVRNALAHLYDYAHLQNHPLVHFLTETENLDDITRAQQLRRLLLDCIDALKSRPEETGPKDAMRAYAILTYRYVDGLSMQEICGKLSISRRQLYREHAKGILALASILSGRLPEARDSNAGHDNRLEAAQVEVGRLRQSSRVECLDISAILGDACNLLAPLTQDIGVSIHVLPICADCSVVADRMIVRQALLNLLTHAVDTVGQSDVIISCDRLEQGLVLRVEVPQPANGGSRSPHSPRGEGLGLAVAQQLIETQGGQLLEDRNKGAWYAQIVLPAPSTRTVLVVDDNVQIVDLLQRYVGGHRISVVGAADGPQALRLAAELQPELILLDIMLPTQDGWEILQKLKENPDTMNIPIAICSVLDERRLALAMGASDYITKPVNQVELLNVLRRWLGTLHPAV